MVDTILTTPFGFMFLFKFIFCFVGFLLADCLSPFSFSNGTDPPHCLSSNNLLKY